jgi:hypothetical protein
VSQEQLFFIKHRARKWLLNLYKAIIICCYIDLLCSWSGRRSIITILLFIYLVFNNDFCCYFLWLPHRMRFPLQQFLLCLSHIHTPTTQNNSHQWYIEANIMSWMCAPLFAHQSSDTLISKLLTYNWMIGVNSNPRLFCISLWQIITYYCHTFSHFPYCKLSRIICTFD